MSILGRLMNAARAAYTTFREQYIIPRDEAEWIDGRQSRLSFLRSMYNNSQYWKSEKQSALFKYNFGLYKHTRGIENPYYQLVELIAAITQGDHIDMETLKSGVFHVVGGDETLIEALLQLINWSKWARNKSLYARLCAMLGDVGLWIVDDRERQQVRIEVLDPAKIREATFDDVGNVKAVWIEYEKEWLNPDTGKKENILYGMKVDKEWFETFKDNQPFAFHADQNGQMMQRWENEYGFVPLKIVNFKDVGYDWGVSCYHAGIPKINEANDLGSILDDGIRKAADPPWYIAGVTVLNQLVFGGQTDDGTSTTEPSAQRDDDNIIGGPKDSQPHSMAPDIPVGDINSRIDSLRTSFVSDNPIMAIPQMREKLAGMSGVAIRNMLVDADGYYKEIVTNLNDGIVQAFQMGISIAAHNGYDKFKDWSLDSYKQGAIDFYLKAPEIFQDAFTPQEEVDIISNLPENDAAALYILVNKLQMSEEDAQKIIDGRAAQQPQQLPDGVDVQPGNPPQLPAGQGQPNAAPGDDVDSEVNRILSEIGIAA